MLKVKMQFPVLVYLDDMIIRFKELKMSKAMKLKYLLRTK